MRHAVLLGILLSAGLLIAQEESGKGHQMTGTICNSACVVKQANAPTCDRTCTEKTGDAVFVDDQGKVMKIENQQMAMHHMGKHVKVMALPSEKEREETLRIMQLTEEAP